MSLRLDAGEVSMVSLSLDMTTHWALSDIPVLCLSLINEMSIAALV